MVIILTKIYFVRHCEALGNVQRIFQGVTDTDVTELGEQQLELLKERFSNINIDKIYTSPLKRAVKTALAVKGEKDIQIINEDGLIEINGGSIEGKKFADTFEAFPHLAEAWNNHPGDFAPDGGEPMSSAYERIWDTLMNIVKTNKGKTIACSSHGGVIRCLLCRLLFNNINELKNAPWSENTAVTLLEVDDDFKIKVSFINDVSHLPSELLPQRSRIARLVGAEK